eukprot:6192674-Pleurochrysis_carterae.AAC.2
MQPPAPPFPSSLVSAFGCRDCDFTISPGFSVLRANGQIIWLYAVALEVLTLLVEPGDAAASVVGDKAAAAAWPESDVAGDVAGDVAAVPFSSGEALPHVAPMCLSPERTLRCLACEPLLSCL